MIPDYVETLVRELDFDRSLSRSVRQEVEDHLWEAVAADSTGDMLEAQRRAIADFGDARAIAAQFGNVSLVRVTVDHNRATEKGGGLYAPNGSVNLRQSTVQLNVAGQFAIESGLVIGPRPEFFGGGVFANDVNALESTIRRNTAFVSGGGISAVTVHLSRSTVSGRMISPY